MLKKNEKAIEDIIEEILEFIAYLLEKFFCPNQDIEKPKGKLKDFAETKKLPNTQSVNEIDCTVNKLIDSKNGGSLPH